MTSNDGRQSLQGSSGAEIFAHPACRLNSAFPAENDRAIFAEDATLAQPPGARDAAIGGRPGRVASKLDINRCARRTPGFALVGLARQEF